MGNSTVLKMAHVLCAASFLSVGWFGAAVADCDPGHVHLSGDWGQAKFSVEIADDPEERSQGLMHRDSMASSAGMLFVFEVPHQAQFWMKNTLIPLDLLFFDSAGLLLNMRRDAVPGDLTGLSSEGSAQFVLEINGGLAKRLRIGPNTQLIHPTVKNIQTSALCGE